MSRGSQDGEGTAAQVKRRADRFDAYQQQHPVLAVPIAVVRKFTEDQSTNLASMIAFWAFFSIFPLLLVFVTLLGFFVPDDLKRQVLTQVAAFFPLLNASAIGSLTGEWWTLVVGVVSGLWSGSAVVRTIQFAFNSVWEIPYRHRPGIGEQILRSLLVLSTIGLGLVVSTLISGFVTGASGNLGIAGRIGGFIVAIALDVGLFIAAFRMLTDRDVSTREILPGALLSGVVFWVLQQVASLIISRYLQNAQSTYGNFATVITMLWWFYLQAIIMMLGAQLNVVLKDRLYPRALVDAPDTEADQRAYRSYAQERTYLDEQRVDVEFPEEGDDPR